MTTVTITVELDEIYLVRAVDIISWIQKNRDFWGEEMSRGAKIYVGKDTDYLN